MNKTPNHIALIMDGNRRWSKFNHKTIKEGYEYGLKALQNTILFCITSNIKFVTCYAFSTENWNRSSEEINNLKLLLEYYISKEVDFFNKNNIKLNVIGSYHAFGEKIYNSINKLIDITKNNTSIILTLALNYGSKAEILTAIKSLAHDINNNIVDVDKIDEDTINNYLYTKNLPEVDLLIRTGGEKRLSNFLLFQIAYTNLFFINKMWPDFNETDLQEILKDYSKIKNNRGL